MTQYLDFEKSLAEIEGKAAELRAMARNNPEMDVEKEAAALDKKGAQLLGDLYKALTPWQKCLVARHPNRPHCQDYINALFTEFTPLAGDRNFADDQAIMGGLARLNDRPVMVIGQEHLFHINGYSQVTAKTIFKRKYLQITQQYHFWYQDLQVQK